MSLSQLPPVGAPFPVKAKADYTADLTGHIQAMSLVNSGTAALALAFMMAKAERRIDEPEVIIPAYGCPDLVAAAVFAGVTPVVVDVEATPYQYRTESLAQSLTDKTIAVLCTTLLGIRMQPAHIKNIIPEHVQLIEDNAQWFPEQQRPLSDEQDNVSVEFDSSFSAFDYSITSFGRGKPVNLLGGGAIFLHSREKLELFTTVLKEHGLAPDRMSLKAQTPSSKFQHKGRLFNLLCKPFLYGLVTRVPFLKLGETAYHSLAEISMLHSYAKNLLPVAIEAYSRHDRITERLYREQIKVCDFAQQSPNMTLRYPVGFTTAASRDAVLSKLSHLGLGCSSFYNNLLPDITGVRDRVKQYSAIETASFFAHNMITLPTHPGVSARHAEKIVDIIQATLSSDTKVRENITND